MKRANSNLWNLIYLTAIGAFALATILLAAKFDMSAKAVPLLVCVLLPMLAIVLRPKHFRFKSATTLESSKLELDIQTVDEPNTME